MEWINVNNQMPEENEFVIVYAIEEKWLYDTPFYPNVIIGSCFSNNRGWEVSDSEGRTLEIKYWLKIPEIPKE